MKRLLLHIWKKNKKMGKEPEEAWFSDHNDRFVSFYNCEISDFFFFFNF